MKIGFNYKKLKDLIYEIYNQLYAVINITYSSVEDDVDNHETRITSLEENSDEWVEITSSNGLEAEITQEFSEIRMLAKVGLNSNYVVTCNYDSNIFHNTIGNEPTYIIYGNPTENNYGCKFKYMVTGEGKQYVSAENCFEGGGNTACTFRAWIKPVNSSQ